MDVVAVTKLDVLDDFPSIHVSPVIDWMATKLTTFRESGRVQPLRANLGDRGWLAIANERRTVACRPSDQRATLSGLPG